VTRWRMPAAKPDGRLERTAEGTPVMIEGLDNALRASGRPGLVELRTLLSQVLGGSPAKGRLTGERSLKKRKVYRLVFDLDGQPRSLVVKGASSARAHCNRLAVTRWLPAVGLGQHCAAWLGMAADPSGQWVWQIYEDLGDQTLETKARSTVEAAVDLMAALHVRFADHPLLPECRMYGKDMGTTYYLANIRDAIRGLEHLKPSSADAGSERLAVRDRLLLRMYKLLDEGPDRARIQSEFGGPETMLHGDLWRKNIMVFTQDGPQIRLIDWDATGVGPLTYDLSTLLYRSPAEDRPWILDRYQQSVAPLGWRPPAESDLNLMLETAEISRIANCLAWAGVSALDPQADWVFESLAEIERWFEAVEPAI
jgi:thiamine kinase-like enzyme